MNSIIIDLNNFKIKKCNILRNHDKLKCIYYHNKFDERRDIRKSYYENMLCNNIKNCNKNCKLCHNKFELLYHPKNYKKTYCRNYLNSKPCKYQLYCSFAHNDKELRINLLHEMKFNYDFFMFHLKTEFCPLPAKVQHNKFKCVYAHNYQDFRRKPNNNLINEYCENWESKKFIKIYEEGCNKGYECNKCHGWKEKEYHYKNYFNKNVRTISTIESINNKVQDNYEFFTVTPHKRKEIIY